MDEPIARRRNNARVFGEMLKPEVGGRDGTAVAVDDVGSKETSGFFNTFFVMAKGTTRKMRKRALAGIKPVVQRHVVGQLAPVAALGRKRMVIRMHRFNALPSPLPHVADRWRKVGDCVELRLDNIAANSNLEDIYTVSQLLPAEAKYMTVSGKAGGR